MRDRTDTHAQDARAIYQEYLDHMARALLARDADGFFARLSFPHVMITEDQHVVTEHRAELEELFRSVSANLIEQRVTDYARIVKWAAFETPSQIIGRWDTHIMSNATRLSKPYPSQGRLICVDGSWLSSHVVQGFRYQDARYRFPLVADMPVLHELDADHATLAQGGPTA